ncbi:hypothetical protein OFA97_01180 [Lactiplantibacillus plantarum]|nr:hypothetical protein OFA97_01180 [Lactiplantibacillus plantarum]
MDFVDVYGIKHENCTLVAPAREYSQHWHQAQPSAAPEGYFHIDQE